MSATNVWYVLFRGNEAVNEGLPDRVRLVEGDESVASFCETVHSKRSNEHSIGVSSATLQVYKLEADRVADLPSKKQLLLTTDDLKDIIGPDCGSKNNPLIVVIPSVWYTLVEGGHLDKDNYKDLPAGASVKEFKSAVFSTWSSKFSGKSIQAEDLQVFVSEQARRPGGELASDEKVHTTIGGRTREHPLIVVAPVATTAWEERLSPGASAKKPKTIVAPPLATSTVSIWYRLFRGSIALGEATCVTLDHEGSVDTLQRLIHQEWRDLLIGISSPQLQVYKSEEEGHDNSCIDRNVKIRAFAATSQENHLVVVAPPLGVESSDKDDLDYSGVSVGNVVIIARVEQRKRLSIPLYLRERSIIYLDELHKFFNDEKLKRLYVTGAPGCGKTCLFGLWQGILAKRHLNESFLRVLYRNRGDCCFTVQKGEDIQTWWVDEDALLWSVKFFVQSTPVGFRYRLCIFDGVREKNTTCDLIASFLNSCCSGTDDLKIKQVVHVTSLAFNIKGGDMFAPLEDFKDLSFESWELQDYLDAVQQEAFRNALTNTVYNDFDYNFENTDSAKSIESKSEKLNCWLSNVKSKYFFAGGSARFMFEEPTIEVEKKLEQLFERVGINDWDQFTLASVSAATSTSVNSMMQMFHDGNNRAKYSVLSRFVLRRAYEKCKGKLVKSMEAVANAINNPVLKGWAFEIQQIHVIETVCDKNLKGGGQPKALVSSQDEKLSFMPLSFADFNGKAITSGEIADGTVISCLQWNQPCFDVALYFEQNQGTLVTLQFTTARTHSVKLQYIKQLRNALSHVSKGINVVAHVAVSKAERGFKFDNVSGAGHFTRSCSTKPKQRISGYHCVKLEEGEQKKFNKKTLMGLNDAITVWDIFASVLPENETKNRETN